VDGAAIAGIVTYGLSSTIVEIAETNPELADQIFEKGTDGKYYAGIAVSIMLAKWLKLKAMKKLSKRKAEVEQSESPIPGIEKEIFGTT
jgi:hypothetical protein